MSLNSLLAYGVKLKRIWSTYMNIEKRTTLAPISANKLHEPFGNLPTNFPAIFSNMNDVYNNTSYITDLQIVRVTAVQNLLCWELLKQAIFWLDKTCHMWRRLVGHFPFWKPIYVSWSEFRCKYPLIRTMDQFDVIANQPIVIDNVMPSLLSFLVDVTLVSCTKGLDIEI